MFAPAMGMSTRGGGRRVRHATAATGRRRRRGTGAARGRQPPWRRTGRRRSARRPGRVGCPPRPRREPANRSGATRGVHHGGRHAARSPGRETVPRTPSAEAAHPTGCSSRRGSAGRNGGSSRDRGGRRRFGCWGFRGNRRPGSASTPPGESIGPRPLCLSQPQMPDRNGPGATWRSLAGVNEVPAMPRIRQVGRAGADRNGERFH